MSSVSTVNQGGYSAPPPPPTVPQTPQFSQPPGNANQAPALVPWTTGLCKCCTDVPNCCLTCWCPCVTFGRISEIVDRGSSSCGTNGAIYIIIGCLTTGSWVYSCFYRLKMRRQYSLERKPCHDCLVHCFCEYCALCQEYRELRNRGFDMVIGWQANMERFHGQGVTMAPTVQRGMTR